MTVTNLTNSVSEAGNGSKTDFTFAFKVGAASDLRVYKVTTATKAATLQGLPTDYTVSLNTTSDGGTVTYGVAPTASQTSVIRRVPALTQATDIPIGGAVGEDQLEGEFDKRAMIDLHLNDQATKNRLHKKLERITISGGSPLDVDTDLSLARVFEFEPTGDFIINNPINPPTDFDQTMEVMWRIRQPSSSAKTMTLGTKFLISPDVAASLSALQALVSAVSGVTDYLTAEYNQVDDKYYITRFVRGTS